MRHTTYLTAIAATMLALAATSCGQKTDNTKADAQKAETMMSENRDSILATAEDYTDTVQIGYAKGLKVDYTPSGTILVTITNPDKTRHSAIPPMQLALCKKGQKAGDTPQGALRLDVPVKGVVCMTALQLSNFAAIACEDRIAGIVSLTHLFNQAVQRQIEQGRTVRIGKEGNFDIETVIAAQPDIIFISESKRGGYETLKDCGIPLIPHHGYKETDPLGQAEWIKLVGLLTGEERKANAMFAYIERTYNNLKADVAAKTTLRPTVVSGRQIRDGWYVMGGKSYMARIFSDAGADYFMRDSQETGGVTLDFEAVYAKAVKADFWQTDGSFEGDYTMATLLAEDARYGDLKAYKDKRVIFCNFAQNPYRELSPVEPHILLADFVKAFHPELLPDYKPKYYTFLK